MSLSVLLLDVAEADDDVGHLNAEIVDVVLHFDRRAAEPEHAHERVAERRVAQMADVRRLVRVDRRVLDDGLVGRAGSAGGTPPRRRASRKAGRSRERLRYPFGAASIFATPGMAPMAPTSSCAIARGALRSGRASWNATVTARSPSARLGGTSIANGGTSARPNCAVTAEATLS